ncbi:MAG: hypothetical protein H0W47_09785 [Polaromonas sp.]|uniref:hypothetical protein n=1 Tax=Polaromonas sp. TaxID=1869339 RepID=UPI0017C0468F|nr:hypothetical protein [Polaromonas sp.]MBA3594072.1 hypothetical protein [Polaromonas sp.]
MPMTGTQALILGAILSATASLAHLACIVWGAPAYRFMGAGEKMARAVEAGTLQPTLVTLAISGVLLVWAAYALGGAGVIDPLPLRKLALPAICAVYLGRAVAFPLLYPAFPENSRTFWLVSSGICLFIGLVHLYGVVAVWPTL